MANVSTTSAFQSIQNTVSNVVQTLIDFGFTTEEVLQAGRIYIFVNTNGIRADWSGNTPTTSSGALVSGMLEVIGNDNIQNIKIIREGTSDSEVFIVLES